MLLLLLLVLVKSTLDKLNYRESERIKL